MRKLNYAILLVILFFSITPVLAESFCAPKDGDQTNFNVNAYNQLTGWSIRYDIDSGFVNNAWIPVPLGEDATTVIFSGQIWVRANGTNPSGNPPSYVVRIIKNNDFSQTIGTAINAVGTYPNSHVMNISMQDYAQPGDSYRLWLFVTSSLAIVDGHPLHTFWCGTTVE